MENIEPTTEPTKEQILEILKNSKDRNLIFDCLRECYTHHLITNEDIRSIDLYKRLIAASKVISDARNKMLDAQAVHYGLMLEHPKISIPMISMPLNEAFHGYSEYLTSNEKHIPFRLKNNIFMMDIENSKNIENDLMKVPEAEEIEKIKTGSEERRNRRKQIRDQEKSVLKSKKLNG